MACIYYTLCCGQRVVYQHVANEGLLATEVEPLKTVFSTWLHTCYSLYILAWAAGFAFDEKTAAWCLVCCSNYPTSIRFGWLDQPLDTRYYLVVLSTVQCLHLLHWCIFLLCWASGQVRTDLVIVTCIPYAYHMGWWYLLTAGSNEYVCNSSLWTVRFLARLCNDYNCMPFCSRIPGRLPPPQQQWQRPLLH